MDKYTQRQAINRSFEQDGYIPQTVKQFKGNSHFTIDKTAKVLAKKLVYKMDFCSNIQCNVTLGHN